MSKKRKHKKKSHHNIFDNVFHTIVTKMPQLIIPIVNLLYGLNIPPDAPIVQLRNEFYERNGKFITDSVYLIAGRHFHFECQSTTDPTMSVRMFQYDTSIAIEYVEQNGDEYCLTYPDSAIIYLRPRNNTNNHKQRHTVNLKLPGNSNISYYTEAIDVQDYTVKDIFQKKLFLFLPFYIMRYEKLFKYNTFDTAWLDEFFHEYADIRDQLYNEFPDERNFCNDIFELIIQISNCNVDVPALPAETYSMLHNKNQRCVIDVGGDDRGALALGRYSEGIEEDGDYELLFVINKFRPLTRDAKSTLEIMAEIEKACHMKFTAIVNDSNIGDETTAEDVLSSVAYANEVSEKAGIPIKMTAVKKDLYNELSDKIDNLMPIELYVRQSWAERNE